MICITDPIIHLIRLYSVITSYDWQYIEGAWATMRNISDDVRCIALVREIAPGCAIMIIAPGQSTGDFIPREIAVKTSESVDMAKSQVDAIFKDILISCSN